MDIKHHYNTNTDTNTDTDGMHVGIGNNKQSDISYISHIFIPKTQLVIGLANGWANNEKFLLLWPEIIANVHEKLKMVHREPHGYMFWDIADEGMNASVPTIPSTSSIYNTNDTNTKPMWMAKGLNNFLHTR